MSRSIHAIHAHVEDEHRAAGIDQHVFRPEVAVRDVDVVGGNQAEQRVAEDEQRRFGGERTVIT